MPRTKGKGGDFHQGIPNKHEGKKGEKADDIRSSHERERARAGELKNPVGETHLGPHQNKTPSET